MDAVSKRIKQMMHAVRTNVSVVFDVVAIGCVVAGVYRLEVGRPGWWLLVAGVLLFAAGFVTQDL